MSKTYSHSLYEMDWIVPGKVSYWKMWGEFTSADIDVWDGHATDILDQVAPDTSYVHAIFDMNEVKKMANLRDYLSLEARDHPKVGWTIIVGPLGSVQRFVLSAATQALRVRTRFVATFEDAVDLLRAVDPTLEALDVEAARAVVEAVNARAEAQRSQA